MLAFVGGVQAHDLRDRRLVEVKFGMSYVSLMDECSPRSMVSEKLPMEAQNVIESVPGGNSSF